MENRRSVCIFFTTTLLFAGAGCGNPLVPVKGRVTLDGQPVSRATVMFVSEEGDRGGLVQPTGNTDADGRFSLRTKTDVGALPGKYRVAVSKFQIIMLGSTSKKAPTPEEPATTTPLGRKKVVQLLPRISSEPQTTTIHVEVPKSGAEDIIIALHSKPGPVPKK